MTDEERKKENRERDNRKFLAKMLDMTPEEFSQRIEEARAELSDPDQAHPDIDSPCIANAIKNVYGKGDDQFGLYSFVCDNQEIVTAHYVPRGGIRDNVSFDELSCTLEYTKRSPASVSRKFLKRIPEFYARLTAGGVALWNRPTYSLESVDLKKASFEFSKTDFLSYRFSYGLLEDELLWALARTQSNQSSPLSLPLREELLPNLRRLTAIGTRPAIGGMGCVTAINTNEGYIIPVVERSKEVSCNREKVTVVPMGYHQSREFDEQHKHLCWTVLHEFYEECVEGRESPSPDGATYAHAPYMNLREMEWFLHNRGWYCELIAFGINGITGNYDVGFLLVIEDPGYWEAFENTLKHNWEIKSVKKLTLNAPEGILAELSHGSWESEGLLHMVEALERLNRRRPQSSPALKFKRFVGGKPIGTKNMVTNVPKGAGHIWKLNTDIDLMDDPSEWKLSSNAALKRAERLKVGEIPTTADIKDGASFSIYYMSLVRTLLDSKVDPEQSCDESIEHETNEILNLLDEPSQDRDKHSIYDAEAKLHDLVNKEDCMKMRVRLVLSAFLVADEDYLRAYYSIRYVVHRHVSAQWARDKFDSILAFLRLVLIARDRVGPEVITETVLSERNEGGSLPSDVYLMDAWIMSRTWQNPGAVRQIEDMPHAEWVFKRWAKLATHRRKVGAFASILARFVPARTVGDAEGVTYSNFRNAIIRLEPHLE